MPRPKSYFGSSEEVREINDRRNAEIRAWGKQQLADADAALLNAQTLLGVPTEPLDVSDWDQISVADDDEIAIAPEPILEELPPEIEKIVREADPAIAKSRTKATPKG